MYDIDDLEGTLETGPKVSSEYVRRLHRMHRAPNHQAHKKRIAEVCREQSRRQQDALGESRERKAYTSKRTGDPGGGFYFH